MVWVGEEADGERDTRQRTDKTDDGRFKGGKRLRDELSNQVDSKWMGKSELIAAPGASEVYTSGLRVWR